MGLAIVLPEDYSLVLAAAVSTFFAGTWLGMRVGSYRKQAKIPYPYEYASYEQVQTAAPARQSAMLAFNAAQRAHQNFNENHVIFLGGLLISGLAYPRAAATLGAVWSVNRIVYGLGYVNTAERGGVGRYYGALCMIAHYVMIGLSTKTAWDLVMA